MQKLIERLRGMTRVYGVILLVGAGLLGVVGILSFAVVLVGSVGSYTTSNVEAAFQKKHPKVKFYLSDFVEEKKVESSRPKTVVELASAKITAAMVPAYTKALDAYLYMLSTNQNFATEEIRSNFAAQQKVYRQAGLEAFVLGSATSIGENFGGLELKDREVEKYADGLVDFIKKADEAGVEIASIKGYPITTVGLGSCRVYNVYHRDYLAQRAKIAANKKTGQTVSEALKDAGIIGLGVYLGLILIWLSMVLVLRLNRTVKEPDTF